MIDARFVPLTRWPGVATPPAKQRAARFEASYSATLDLLERELRALTAQDIVVQAWFTWEQIRDDGWPRSAANPSQSGLILSFTVRKVVNHKMTVTALSFPCDTFDTFDDNLRAIALTLEALRKIDRYGVTQGNQQYTGWKQLPAQDTNNNGSMSRGDAIAFIAMHSGMSMHGAEIDLQYAYRTAARKLHPDSGDGDHELFVKLQKAKEVLGL